MIEVVIADHQEFFRIGMAEVLGATGELRVIGEAESPEQLLNTLKRARPDVLILSTRLLSALPQITRILERRQTALLVLAEESDRTPYMQWLRANGILHRSIDEAALVDAVRRVARGELFVQGSSSDIGKGKSEVA